jgi:hypothetical protein
MFSHEQRIMLATHSYLYHWGRESDFFNIYIDDCDPDNETVDQWERMRARTIKEKQFLLKLLAD